MNVWTHIVPWWCSGCWTIPHKHNICKYSLNYGVSRGAILMPTEKSFLVEQLVFLRKIMLTLHSLTQVKLRSMGALPLSINESMWSPRSHQN